MHHWVTKLLVGLEEQALSPTSRHLKPSTGLARCKQEGEEAGSAAITVGARPPPSPLSHVVLHGTNPRTCLSTLRLGMEYGDFSATVTTESSDASAAVSASGDAEAAKECDVVFCLLSLGWVYPPKPHHHVLELSCFPASSKR